MSQEELEFWTRARRARDKLANLFLDHPAVSLIDIGHPLERGQMGKDIVLRIHVREQWMKAKPEERVAFPKQIDNIPVVVLFGDYQLETDAPAADEE